MNGQVKTEAELTQTMTFDGQSLSITHESVDGKMRGDIQMAYIEDVDADKLVKTYLRIPSEFAAFIVKNLEQF